MLYARQINLFWKFLRIFVCFAFILLLCEGISRIHLIGTLGSHIETFFLLACGDESHCRIVCALPSKNSFSEKGQPLLWIFFLASYKLYWGIFCFQTKTRFLQFVGTHSYVLKKHAWIKLFVSSRICVLLVLIKPKTLYLLDVYFRYWKRQKISR